MKKLTTAEINEHYYAFLDGNEISANIIFQIVQAIVRKVFTDITISGDIDDVIQEVFYKILRGKKFNPEKGTFLGYVLMYAKSTRLDMYRRQEVLFRHLPKYVDNLGASKTCVKKIDDLIIQEQSQFLRNTLNLLSPETIECLLLQFGHNLTLEQISHACSMPLGTVKSRSNRGRKYINENLKKVIV